MKTFELTGPTLDWAVAKCEGLEVEYVNDGITQCLLRLSPFTGRYCPSADWAHGGPIIEQNQLSLDYDCAEGGRWWAVHMATDTHECGPTPLIAAMRCLVMSRLGDEVEIPEELL
jgi:hypothetical protein